MRNKGGCNFELDTCKGRIYFLINSPLLRLAFARFEASDANDSAAFEAIHYGDEYVTLDTE